MCCEQTALPACMQLLPRYTSTDSTVSLLLSVFSDSFYDLYLPQCLPPYLYCLTQVQLPKLAHLERFSALNAFILLYVGCVCDAGDLKISLK